MKKLSQSQFDNLVSCLDKNSSIENYCLEIASTLYPLSRMCQESLVLSVVSKLDKLTTDYKSMKTFEQTYNFPETRLQLKVYLSLLLRNDTPSVTKDAVIGFTYKGTAPAFLENWYLIRNFLVY